MALNMKFVVDRDFLLRILGRMGVVFRNPVHNQLCHISNCTALYIFTLLHEAARGVQTHLGLSFHNLCAMLAYSNFPHAACGSFHCLCCFPLFVLLHYFDVPSPFFLCEWACSDSRL